MLNIIWGAMILIGVVYGAVNGTMADIGNAAINSSKEAVELCITMLGVMGLWMGLMEIAKSAGIMEWMTKKLQPVLRFLFQDIPAGHRALEPISANIIANLLGLGWAATPAGLEAMKELSEFEEKRNSKYARGERSASNEMCTFLVLNISSLQLIPINVIAYRTQYGSSNPTAIVIPAMIATFFSTISAVIYCKWKCRKRGNIHTRTNKSISNNKRES